MHGPLRRIPFLWIGNPVKQNDDIGASDGRDRPVPPGRHNVLLELPFVGPPRRFLGPRVFGHVLRRQSAYGTRSAALDDLRARRIDAPFAKLPAAIVTFSWASARECVGYQPT